MNTLEWFRKHVSQNIIDVHGISDDLHIDDTPHDKKVVLVYPAHDIVFWVSEWGGVRKENRSLK